MTIKGERFLALLDTGSTHTLLQGTAMRRLGLAPHGGEQLRVTVAGSERLPCEGIARDVLVLNDGTTFHITCIGLALGCFDIILGVDFLGALAPSLGTSRGSRWPFSAAGTARCGSAWALHALPRSSALSPR